MSRIDAELIYKSPKLEAKDKKILDVLSENARLPVSSIAKHIRQNRDTTAYRIKRMESLGIIEGYYPKIDFKKLGFNMYQIFIMISNQKTTKDLIDYFKKEEHTVSILEHSDYWNLKITITARNVRELDTILMSMKRTFKDSISDIEKFLEIREYPSILFSYFFEKEKVKKITQAPEEKESYFKPDTYDMKILKELAKDCRQSTYELAKKIDLNADTIGLRIKKLQREHIINRFTILPNLSLLSFTWHTVIIKNTYLSVEDELKLKQYISRNPSILSAAKTFGSANIIMYVIAQDRTKYHTIIKEIKEHFGNTIKSTQGNYAYKEHYFNPFPTALLNAYK